MDKLHEVDLILAQLEDTAHGEDSKKVGMARKLISELIASNGAKPTVSGSAVKNCHHPKGGLLKKCIVIGCGLCPHYR